MPCKVIEEKKEKDPELKARIEMLIKQLKSLKYKGKKQKFYCYLTGILIVFFGCDRRLP